MLSTKKWTTAENNQSKYKAKLKQEQSSRKPTCPKTKASEFEVGPVKIENQEVRLAFAFYQTFYDIL
jgi:hypothetical protein